MITRPKLHLLSAILSLVFGLLSTPCLQAQVKEGILDCDSVVVTCEALTGTDYVMAIMNVAGIGAAPVGNNWPAPAVSARHGVSNQLMAAELFTRNNLGQVFGLAYDNNGVVYTTATSIYSVDVWGGINTVSVYNAYAGQVVNSGSIYKITGTAITELVELPNKGQGLGNICFNRLHNCLYATNFHDGKIYRIDLAGTVQNVFDPNFDGSAYATFPNYAALGQRPWGIAVFGTTTANSILYYSRWSIDCGNLPGSATQRNQIWSVNLDNVGNPIAGTEQLIYTIPLLTSTISGCPNCTGSSNPVADIEISSDGKRMLLSERSMSGINTSAHASRLLELQRSNVAVNSWPSSFTNKYPIGLWCKQNASGGCDFGDYTLSGTKSCNGSVLAMNDYVYSPNTPWQGTAYGFEIVNPAGGDETTGRIIDLNNTPGGQDKTRLGDVDYRRCLNCPVVSECGFFEGYGDSTCCRAGIKRTVSGGGTITSVSYNITDGVCQGYAADCTVSSTAPASLVGTTSGTINFTSCTNLTNLYLSLQATTISGWITVTFTVNFANGQQCVYTVRVKCARPPVTNCDKFEIKQCICQGAALNYIDFKITNQIVPNDPICGVKITKYDNLGNVVTGYWSAGAVITPPATTYNTPFNYVPSAGVLNVITGGQVHFQNYFTGSFSGSVGLVVYHCNGDSCTYTWKPIVWNPNDYAVTKAARVKTKYSKLYATAFKLYQPPVGASQTTVPVKYISMGIEDIAGGAEIVAVTGAEQYPEKERADVMKFSLAEHARHNAFFELREPVSLKVRDSSEFFNIIIANALPKFLRYTLYDASGAVLGTDTLRLDSTGTVGVVSLAPTGTQGRELHAVNGYPNPTNDVYQLRYVNGSSRAITVLVFDAGGREVGRFDEGPKPAGVLDKTLSLGYLPEGIYYVQLAATDGTVSEPLKVVVVK